MPGEQRGTFSTTTERGTKLVQWPGGYAQHRRLGAGVMFLRIVGHAPQELCRHHWQILDPEVAQNARLLLVIDLSALASYDAGYRLAWTTWLRLRLQQTAVHLYTQSQLVRMGATVVGLATNTITVHDTLASLHAVARSAVPGLSLADLPAPLAAAPDKG